MTAHYPPPICDPRWACVCAKIRRMEESPMVRFSRAGRASAPGFTARDQSERGLMKRDFDTTTSLGEEA